MGRKNRFFIKRGGGEKGISLLRRTSALAFPKLLLKGRRKKEEETRGWNSQNERRREGVKLNE